ncbi:MAG: D-Ala-D-Ala carboxypeptidase family metallohydrolase [Bacteroidota bacterium]|nr:D-Ala-D-Ala carboxypeptidase family metallohydrolase [Bacteroidota bacterium]
MGTARPVQAISSENVSVIRTLIVEMDGSTIVSNARIVDFISVDPIAREDFHHLARGWIENDYGTYRVLVVEFDLMYSRQKSQLYDPADSSLTPTAVSLKEITGLGKAQEDPLWCYISDIQFGRKCTYLASHPDDKNCVTIEVYVIWTCVSIGGTGGDDSSGGGSGGGGSDDDEESQCTEDQKAIATEYDDAAWPCEKFVDDVTHGRGTHGHAKGYLSDGYKSGRDAVFSYMSSEFGVSAWINSDWRCPVGNAMVHGVPESTHRKGIAGDFGAARFDEGIWEWFNEAAIDAGRTWNSGFDDGKSENRRSRNYSSHIHIHW